MTGMRSALLTWIGLLALLATGVAITVLAPGPAAHGTVLVLAAIMAGLVFNGFMGLGAASGLMRLFALGGLLWVGFMLFFTLADFLTR